MLVSTYTLYIYICVCLYINLSGMDYKGDMAVHVSGEVAEGCNDFVLKEVLVRRLLHAHHELQIVHDHVGDVTHVHRVRHCLWHGR